MTKPLAFAVIGHPITHSRSPAIHIAFAAQFGIDLTYDRIDAAPADFESTVERFFGEGGMGLNVTVPFKERAWALAESNLSQRAHDARAVNTLWQSAGQMHGCNTDGVGLVNDLQRLGMPLDGARLLILGAGGAARGVLGPLLDAGAAHISVLNRTPDRALSLIDNWSQAHPGDLNRLLGGGFDRAHEFERPAVIINATSSSLQGASLPLPDDMFGADVCAYDMMYGKEPTAFMQHAMACGCQQVADGLGMLVGQAGESFRLWHGKQPAIDAVVAQIRAQLDGSVR